MAEAAALEVTGLSRSFSGLRAVDRMSFELAAGEVLGLIGPNGSGKTTVINLISGALRQDGGSIRLGGRDITGQRAHRVARLGIARTFQIVRVLPTLTIEENVAAGGVFGHRRLWADELRETARRLLQRVGVTAAPEGAVSTLTYIDQKRVELARALISDPAVLLLDEWMAGLNPTELQAAIELIRDLAAEGRTILIVEHVMHAIRSLCDRCIVMNSGAKIAEGSTRDVLEEPEVVRAYLGDDDLGPPPLTDGAAGDA